MVTMLLAYFCNESILTDNRRLKIHEHSSRYMFPVSCFREECGERCVTVIIRHHSLLIDSMLQAIKLPTCAANLTSRLTNVDRYTLTLKRKQRTINQLYCIEYFGRKLSSCIWNRWAIELSLLQGDSPHPRIRIRIELWFSSYSNNSKI